MTVIVGAEIGLGLSTRSLLEQAIFHLIDGGNSFNKRVLQLIN